MAAAWALALLAVAGSARASAGPASGFEAGAAARFGSAGDSPAATLALPVSEDGPLALRLFGGRKKKPAAPAEARGDSAAGGDSAAAAAPPARSSSPALGAERAQLVLRSITVPGWGQAASGHPTAAAVFGLLEAGVWTSFVSFRVQEGMRTSSYEHTAQLYAGIDLSRRDEEFRRIVGLYSSSDQYNQLVVYRDAANLYFKDPQHMDYAGYHAYIAAHQLQGTDTWSWDGPDSQLRYRGQRKSAQRAALRANTALGLAIVNRLVSVLHAARLHGRADAHPRSWNIEVTPDPGTDPTAFRFGVRTRF